MPQRGRTASQALPPPPSIRTCGEGAETVHLLQLFCHRRRPGFTTPRLAHLRRPVGDVRVLPLVRRRQTRFLAHSPPTRQAVHGPPLIESSAREPTGRGLPSWRPVRPVVGHADRRDALSAQGAELRPLCPRVPQASRRREEQLRGRATDAVSPRPFGQWGGRFGSLRFCFS